MNDFKTKILSIVFLLTLVGVAAAAKITDDSLKLCIPNTADTCAIVFDMNDGASNVKLQAASGELKVADGVLTDTKITASDIDLGTATDTSRLTVSKGTSAVLGALTRKAGAIFYDTDQAGVVLDNGADLVPVGTGAGGSGSGVNLVENPDFEINVNSWAASAGVVTKETTIVGNGAASLKWTPTGTGENLLPTEVVVPKILNNRACLATFQYRYTGGADGDITAKVVDGATDLTTAASLTNLTGTNEWNSVQIGFTCPEGGSPRVKIETATASPQPLFIDDVWTGTDYRIGSDTAFKGERIYDITSFLNLSTGGTVDLADAQPYKDPDGNWRMRLNIVIGGAGANTIHDLTIDGVKWKTALQAGSASGDAAGGFSQTAGSGVDPASYVIRYSASQTGVRASGDFALFEKPTWADDIQLSQTVTLETQGWFVKANIGGTNAGLGTAGVTVPDAVSNNSLDLINGGTATAGIACENLESNVGDLDCGATSENIGVVFNAPYSGYYKACATFAFSNNDNNTFFTLDYTELDSDTVISSGGPVTAARGPNGAQQITAPISICGYYNFTAGKKTIRLLRTQSSTSTGSTILGDRVTTVSGRNITIVVYPLTQNFPQAVALVGDEFYIADLGGALTGGVWVHKLDGWVTLNFDGNITHSAGSGPASASGIIPAGYRPVSNTKNAYSFDATAVYSVEVDENGLVRFRYYDWAGSAVNKTGTDKPNSISYKAVN